MRLGAVIASLGAVTLLGGCQSVFGVFSKGGSELSSTSGSDVFSEAGRKALAAGAFGTAIEEFSRALAHGENRAVAINGLGVAYAKIGRADLAHRYFSEAVIIEPDNPSYAANLNRLISSPAFAMRNSGDVGNELIAQHATESAAGRQDIGSEASVGRLVRSGPREFQIVSAAEPTSGSKLAQVTRSTAVSTTVSAVATPRVVFTSPTARDLSRFKPEVTVTFTGNSVRSEPTKTVNHMHDLRGFKPLVTVTLTSEADAKR